MSHPTETSLSSAMLAFIIILVLGMWSMYFQLTRGGY